MRDKSPLAEGPGLRLQEIQDQKNSGPNGKRPVTFPHQESAPSPMLVVLWRRIIEKEAMRIYSSSHKKFDLKFSSFEREVEKTGHR